MKDIILINGAPGSGKTTVSNLLRNKLKSPSFDFGRLREPHLDRQWSNTSKEEESMAFENLVFILRNYYNHGFKNVIVNDLQDERAQLFPELFKDLNFIIISLVINNDEELRKRVLGDRDSGYKDVDSALVWNRILISRPLLVNEYKIDNTHNEPDTTVEEIIKLIN